MIIENLTQFSDSQAVTETAEGDYYVNQLAAGVAIGQQLSVIFLVTTAFAGQGSSTLVLAVQGDSDSAFGTAVTLSATEAIDESLLVAGYSRELVVPANASYQYLRVYYTVASGPMTAGKIQAHLGFTPYERNGL